MIIKDNVNQLGDYEYDDLRDSEELYQGEIEVNDLNKEKQQAGYNGSNVMACNPVNEALENKTSFWSKLISWWS